MNTLVNFELAKLLKEKGFDFETQDYFLEDGIEYSYPKKENWNLKPNTISAPSIAEVVMWLYEKHDVWISVDKEKNNEFYYLIRTKTHDNEYDHFNSPTEAYEAAIEYTLKNLI